MSVGMVGRSRAWIWVPVGVLALLGIVLVASLFFGPTAFYYWSASTITHPAFPDEAWSVVFVNGFMDIDGKIDAEYVRAVR